VEGDIRIHMHLVSPVTTRMPLTPVNLRNVVFSSDTEHGARCTDTFPLPLGASKLTHITRYWLVIVVYSICSNFEAILNLLT